MHRVYPHEYFRLDFDQMLEEGRRQERIHPANAGEAAIVSGMHSYFDEAVLPMIRENDWVYEAASEFADKYAVDYFHVLRLDGQQIFDMQQRLLDLNRRVVDFLARARLQGAMRVREFEAAGMLPKASDFDRYVRAYALTNTMRLEGERLHEEAEDHEMLQIKTTLRGIQVAYETLLPRVMYVVRRVIKLRQGLPPEARDNGLISVSEDITWYEAHVCEESPLYPIFSELRAFYKRARNVASHHEGMAWEPKQDEVVLEDRTGSIRVHIHQFQRRYRDLLNLCEIGLRGILAGFSDRERGGVSNHLAREYMKTFPERYTGGEPGTLVLYPEVSCAESPGC